METIFFDRTRAVIEEKELLERRLKVKLNIVGRKVTVEGNAVDEYEATVVLNAMNFGFNAHDALLLKDEDFMFRIVNIKDFTRRKDLVTVKARIIGSEGRTKRTIENLSDCQLIVKGNEVGIICVADEMDDAITALANLIRGSKQSNVYKYLEKRNTQRKTLKDK